MEFVNPDGLTDLRRGPNWKFSHTVRISGGADRVLISGQIGRNQDGILADTPEAQITQVLSNLDVALRAHGLTFANLAKTTVYLTAREYIPFFREERARWFGDALPTATLVIVAGLADPAYVIEMEGEAIVPIAT